MSTEMEVSDKDLKVQAALENLVDMARERGFKVKWVNGRNGSCAYWANRIEVGKGLSLVEKLVVLSHEVGHALDYASNFPELHELVLMVGFYENYKLSQDYNRREENAWRHAEATLRKMEIWGEVEKEFLLFKGTSLAAYNKRHLKAREEGKDRPSKEALKEAYSKLVYR